jgi:hypothetical protein
MAKYYINVRDYQGGSWAMGCLNTIKEWQEVALEWCDSDENWEMYDYIKKHELNEKLIGLINDVWSINIVPFNKDNIEDILDCYTNSRYDLNWLFTYIMDILEGVDK